MKKIALSIFFLGITLYVPIFFTFTAEEEITIEERIKELERRQIDPAITAKKLAGGIEDISEKIDLTPEEQKRIQEQMQRLKKIVAEKKRGDKYTQSEAHLSLGKIRRLITQNFDTEPYFNIISSCLAKEGELKKTHYVFYHGLTNVWRLPQDLYRKLHERLYPLSEKIEDFTFLRWQSAGDMTISARQFVVDQLVNHGLINDNFPDTKAVLLSVNLALFGNVGSPSECTWSYFLEPKSHASPDEGEIKKILDTFGATHEYVEQLVETGKLLLRTREQTLLQIFIPRDIVDYIAYISFTRGIPAHQEIMDWIFESVKKKKKLKVSRPLRESFKELETVFKTEQDRFPIFKELYERAEKGDFSVDALLEIYRNTPDEIDNINHLQARLVFTKNILLNPGIGIKFFKYDTVPYETMQEYNEKLDELVDQIIQERLSRAKKES